MNRSSKLTGYFDKTLQPRKRKGRRQFRMSIFAQTSQTLFDKVEIVPVRPAIYADFRARVNTARPGKRAHW